MAPQIYERENASRAVSELLAEVARAAGGFLVLQGTAGMGKSTLLALARRDAQDAGFSVLSARGAVLEQQFPFGLVHQLFASGRAPSPSPAADPGQTYAVLQQLYWDLVDRADRTPVLLVVDDVQWADEASLRFLAFLQGRVEAVRVGLLVATRTGSPEVRALLMATNTRVLELESLGRDAVGAWLFSALQAPPSSAFTGQVLAVTGGNPFLLTELTRQMAAESITPDDGHLQRVTSLSPTAVTMSVLLRLSGTAPATASLAHWLAVLESAEPTQLAAVSGSTQEQTDAAIAELIAAGVAQAGDPVQFLHPLIRTAVYSQHSSTQRAAYHAVAARALHDSGASPDLVAAHVLQATPPTSWAIPLLRSAARRADAAGSPAIAVNYLRRALIDHGMDATADGSPAELLLELGRATASLDLTAAREVLQQALTTAEDPALRRTVQVELSRAQRFSGEALAATDMLLALRDSQRPGDDAGTAALDAEIFACASVSISARHRFRAWSQRATTADRTVARAERSRIVAATAALDAALDSQPLSAVQDFSASAVTGLAGAETPALQGNILSLVGLAALVTDQLDQAAAIFQALLDRTNVDTLADRHADMLGQRASLYLRRGDLADAASEARRALDLAAEARAGRTLLPRAAAVIVAVAAERGEEPELSMLTDDIDADSIAFRLLAYSRAELLAARGHHSAAAAAFGAYGQVNVELGWTGAVSPWRSQLALCRVAARSDRAGSADVELVEQELALAVRGGTARAIGVATRALGLLSTGADRVRLLAESATWLRSDQAPVELAWTLADLGREHLHLGHIGDARTHLAAAHRLAGRSGARRLETRVSTDLIAAGARPHPTRRTGVGALTPAELATTTHAAAGLSNRKIARTMFVTEKTVEAHLHNAYRKLSITGRSQLAYAFAPPTPAARPRRS